MRLTRERAILLIILFLATALRLLWLQALPPALNWDEVSHGFNAYSILKTGADEWGQRLPNIFRAYGDYKLPVYIYLTAATESLFGLSEFAVRLPSALAGIGSVFFTYLLAKKLFNSKIALISALLLALEPWGVFLSRIAAEANVAVFLIISGTYYYLNGLNKKHVQTLLGLVLLGLSAWTYNSARIFTPLLLIFLFIIHKREHLKACTSKQFAALYSIIVIIFFIPMFLQLLEFQGQARYGNVKIINEGAIAQIEEQRNTSSETALLKRLKYNRPVYFSREFTKNYLSHLGPQFLFLTGGDNFQFNVPQVGLLYIVNLPLFYFGLLKAIKKYNKKEYAFLLSWLLIAPIASSTTREAPHALRSIVMLPTPMILSAIGLFELKKYLSRINSFYMPTYFAILSVSALLYLSTYTNEYRTNYSHAWQFGNKEVAKFINTNYEEYDKIVMTKKYGEPHEFLLFYLKWDPKNYVNDPNLNRFNQSNWWWVDGFDKFYFVNDWEIPQESTSKFIQESKKEVICHPTDDCLLITSKDNAPPNWNKIKEIHFLDGKIAYELYTN